MRVKNELVVDPATRGTAPVADSGFFYHLHFQINSTADLL